MYGNLGLQIYRGDSRRSWRRILLERHIGMMSCVLGQGQGREVEEAGNVPGLQYCLHVLHGKAGLSLVLEFYTL